MAARDSRTARTEARLSSLSRTVALLRRSMARSHTWRKALMCLVLATLVGLTRPTTAAQPEPDAATLWSDPEVVGESGDASAIDVDEGGNAYVVWADGSDVSFRIRSADGTWQPVEPVVTYPDRSQYSVRASAGSVSPAAPLWVNHIPEVAVDGLGRAHVVWINNTPYPDRGTYVRYRLRDAGASWEPMEEIAEEAAEIVRLAADGSGRAYVVWQDEVSLESKLRVRSSNGSWGGVESIGSGMPGDVTVDAAGNLYALLNSEASLYFRYRSAAGEWGALEVVSDEAAASAGTIDVDSAGNVYAVYVTRNGVDPGGIYLSHRSAGGTWQGGMLVGQGYGPSLALDAAGNGYFAWLDDQDGDHIVNLNIYAAYRWQDGLWGADSRLTSSSTGVGSLDIATGSSGGLFYVVWAEPNAEARRDIQFVVGSRPADSPDLSAARKTAVPGGVRPGEVVEYVFEVPNAGKTSAFVLTDTLPISTTLVPESGWYDTGVLTMSTRGITWTAVSTFGTTVRAGFSVAVTEDNGTGTLRIPYVLSNVAGLSFGMDQYIELTAMVIVNPSQLYLPFVIRGG